MSDKLDKVLQIRLSSREQEMIKRAFVGTNVSNMVRMYLITEAEKILENFEMEEVDDFDKAYEHHKEMGCICFENKAMGIYFISDPDNYWIEILPANRG